jgi:hypothetical protein
MKEQQNADLCIQFDLITRKLRESGADLGRIKIAMERNAAPSYITRRIMAELEGSWQK